MKKIALVILLALPSFAATRYVATTGTDTGTCTNIASPCATITYTENLSAAGDIINVRAGTYREKVRIWKSGSAGSPITIQNYNGETVIIDASTAVPTSGSWTLDSGSVYKATVNFAVKALVVDDVPYLPASVIGDPSPRSAITIGQSTWYWDENTTTLYVYVTAGDSPAGHDVVALPARTTNATDNGVYGCSISYVTLKGMTIRGSSNGGAGFDNSCAGGSSHITYDGVTVKFNMSNGVGMGQSYGTLQNSTVQWNMMNNFPRGRCLDPVNLSNDGYGGAENIAVDATAKTFTRSGTPIHSQTGSFLTDGVTNGTYIQFTGLNDAGNNNVFLITGVTDKAVTVSDPTNLMVTNATNAGAFYKAHNVMNQPTCQIFGGWAAGVGGVSNHTLLQNNTIAYNGGEGTLDYGPDNVGTYGNNSWIGNTVHDNWSVNIYMDNEPNGLVQGNFVYSNPDASWKTNNGVISGLDSVAKRFQAVGIGTSDEYYDGNCRLTGFQIIDNIVIGGFRGYGHAADTACSGVKNAVIANNVFVLPTTNGTSTAYGSPFVGIHIEYNAGNNTNSLVENNIIYGQGSSNRLIECFNGTAAQCFSGITYNNNSWYHPTNATPFYWVSTSYNWTNWQSLAGTPAHGANDISTDPSMIDATSFVAADKALSSSSSPAYHAGTYIVGTNDTYTDYAGNAWNNPPSIGAYEFGSSSPQPVAPVPWALF